MNLPSGVVSITKSIAVAETPLLNAKNFSGSDSIVPLIFLFTATLVDKNDLTFPSSN